MEPASCPSLTRGEYRYDFGDTAGFTPLMKMHTLGHDFVPDPIHAGGLRYHGMAPLISHIYELGLLEAIAIEQTECFAAAITFARTEGIVPAPEPTHALAATIREALACKESGEDKVIVTALCGHGLLDLAAYDAYLGGRMVDSGLSDQDLASALAAVPVLARLTCPPATPRRAVQPDWTTGAGTVDDGVAVGEALAAALDLELLPLEGGLFRRTFTGGGATAILFMLIGDDFSAMHRLASDEIYFHHAGSPLRMLLIDPQGAAQEVVIGPDALAGAAAAVPRAGRLVAGVVDRRPLEPGLHGGVAGIRLARLRARRPGAVGRALPRRRGPDRAAHPTAAAAEPAASPCADHLRRLAY